MPQTPAKKPTNLKNPPHFTTSFSKSDPQKKTHRHTHTKQQHLQNLQKIPKKKKTHLRLQEAHSPSTAFPPALHQKNNRRKSPPRKLKMRKLTRGKTPTFSFRHGATDRGEVKEIEKSRAEEEGGIGGGRRSWFHPEKLKQQMKVKGEQSACFYYICYIFLLVCVQVIILSCHT